MFNLTGTCLESLPCAKPHLHLVEHPFAFPFLSLFLSPSFLPRADSFEKPAADLVSQPPRFKIEDAKYAKDSMAAWACIRLDRLQQGYRFVHLMDMKGQLTAGLLFVKIEKTLTPVEAKVVEVVMK